MPFLLGTDEAGYGPNLGPLVVSGSLWRSPETSTDLYETLSSVFSASSSPGRIFVADSKKVYQSNAGIGRLETGVLSLLYALHQKIPADWGELAELLECSESCQSLFWLKPFSPTLPLKADSELIRENGIRIRDVSIAKGCELIRIKSRAVFPEEFNSLVDKWGNKASLLSAATLKLAKTLIDTVNAQSENHIKAVCDKHGGRSKYAGLLQEFVSENQLVWVGDEGVARSEYAWKNAAQKFEFSFVAGGESFLPTAVASMFSKYTREVFMKAWNSYWQLEIPDLEPTKGYPVDAKRFKHEIATRQAELGIADATIWRCR